MADKNNTNKHTDDDIAECKADILRAGGDEPSVDADDDDDINIFEDDDLDDSSFEITLEDSEIETKAKDETVTAKQKPEVVVPEFNIGKRILVNERREASGRRQRTAASSEKKTDPSSTKPKNIIPEATGSMGALLNEAKKKRGGGVRQNEIPASKKPAAEAKKKIPIVELPRRTIKDIKITSEPVVKQPAMAEEANDLQHRIISEIVSRDLARFCSVK